jgi:lyso-ornithine lipid O-acyltransferase
LKFLTPLKLGWKVLCLNLHLVSGIALAFFYLRNGIHQQATASAHFVKWNRGICNIFHATITSHGKMQAEPTLYVMNHISWFDIPVLACQQPLHFLSKAEIRNWPLIGWLANRAGTLFIKRGRHGAAQKSLEEITNCLQSGGSVVIFPEGTTTDGKSIRKFHGRLLQAAIDAQVKIQPIALKYPYQQGINPLVPYIDSMTFMDSLLGLTRANPLDVELHFLLPIDIHLDHTTETSNKQLAELSHHAIAKQLGLK